MTSPRMKELQISTQGILTIDTMRLPTLCVIVLDNGKAKISELPGYAETKIITYQGKVKRVKWDEAEDF